MKLDAVTGIVVGVGPGPYTGLRVGLVTADDLRRRARRPRARAVHAGRPRVRRRAPDRGPLRRGHRRPPQGGLLGAVRRPAHPASTEPAVDRPADIAEQVAGLPAVGAGALLYPDGLPGRPRGHARAPVGRRARLAGRREAGRGRGTACRRPAALSAPPRRPGARRTTRWSPPSDRHGHEPSRCARCAGGTSSRCWSWSRSCSPRTPGRRACSGPSWPTRAARTPPAATSSPRTGGPASSATPGWPPPAAPATSRPSPPPATTGAPASAPGC